MHSHVTVGFVLLAGQLGLSDLVEKFLDRVGSGPWADIAGLVQAGELSEAARRLDETGYLGLAARARLRSQDDGELVKAIDFFASVGATRYLSLAEAQLAAMA